jgi:hypothetical protein
MDINKQIKRFFKLVTIPVYVPGIDISICKNEVIYSATKKSKEGIKILYFVIRGKSIYTINAENSKS